VVVPRPPWRLDAKINRDARLRLQYLAGLGLISYHERSIYQDMLHYRRYPEHLFTATGVRGRALLAVIQNPP
jgi:hypothetical protein